GDCAVLCSAGAAGRSVNFLAVPRSAIESERILPGTGRLFARERSVKRETRGGVFGNGEPTIDDRSLNEIAKRHLISHEDTPERFLAVSFMIHQEPVKPAVIARVLRVFARERPLVETHPLVRFFFLHGAQNRF